MTDEALRRVDELLSELIETVETARALPMSASCVLPRERLLDLLDELREVLPPEMDDARTVIATRDRVIKDAYEAAAETRTRAVAEADAVLADAAHRAEQVVADAERQAAETVRAGQVEHGRLVAATSVHQAAAQAASVLREDAERYQAQVTGAAQEYDARIRGEADRYAQDARAEAERYATKLTADAEDYAERTLDELSAVLHKAAATAEQGRTTLAQRRAGHWADVQDGHNGQDGQHVRNGQNGQDVHDGRNERDQPPISA
jgi:cell division septum initiation protein DivIVA